MQTRAKDFLVIGTVDQRQTKDFRDPRNSWSSSELHALLVCFTLIGERPSTNRKRHASRDRDSRMRGQLNPNRRRTAVPSTFFPLPSLSHCHKTTNRGAESIRELGAITPAAKKPVVRRPFPHRHKKTEIRETAKKTTTIPPQNDRDLASSLIADIITVYQVKP